MFVAQRYYNLVTAIASLLITAKHELRILAGSFETSVIHKVAFCKSYYCRSWCVLEDLVFNLMSKMALESEPCQQ